MKNAYDDYLSSCNENILELLLDSQTVQKPPEITLNVLKAFARSYVVLDIHQEVDAGLVLN